MHDFMKNSLMSEMISTIQKEPLKSVIANFGMCDHTPETMIMAVETSFFCSISCATCPSMFPRLHKGDFVSGCLQCKYVICDLCAPVSAQDYPVKAIGKCSHCQRFVDVKFRCPCGVVYCSRKHQKQDWVTHRDTCCANLSITDE